LWLLYYQRVYKDGDLQLQVDIYRDPENGPCGVCMMQGDTWKEGVIDEAILYDSRLEIDVGG
jgi:hypothetical protein